MKYALLLAASLFPRTRIIKYSFIDGINIVDDFNDDLTDIYMSAEILSK
jgi:hypothetical protein